MSHLLSSHCPNSHYIPGNHILVLPAELLAETAEGAVLPARLEAEHTEGLGDDHALLVVIWRRDTLKGLQACHGGGTTLSLVGNHAADGAPKHLGGLAVVPWATTSSVETGLLAEEGLVLHCSRKVISLMSCACKNRPAPILLSCARCARWMFSWEDVRLARKNSPEMLSCSQRTTTIFWPFSSCLATVDARRPRRWPLPSTTTSYGRQYTISESSNFPQSAHFQLVQLGSAREDVHRGNAYHRLEGRHICCG